VLARSRKAIVVGHLDWLCLLHPKIWMHRMRADVVYRPHLKFVGRKLAMADGIGVIGKGGEV
jgi:hypothetical protein